MINRRLLQKVQSVRTLLILTVGLGVATSLIIMVQAILLARIVNAVFILQQGLAAVWPSLLWLLSAVLLRAFISSFSEVSAVRMALRVKTELRVMLTKHLFTLGPAYMKKEHSGELVNTAYEGVEQLEPYLARYLPQISLSALTPLAILVYVLTKDLVSAIILLVTAPLIPFFMILVGKAAQAATDKQWKTLSVLSAQFVDVLRGLTTLKLFNRGKAQFALIERISDQYRKTTMGTLRVAFLSAFVLELLTTLSTAMVAVGLGLRLINADISFANAFVVLLLAPEYYLPIRLLGTQFHAGMNGVTAAERIMDILDTRPLGQVETEEAKVPNQTPSSLQVQDVSFRYSGATSDALQNISFRCDAGETIALVGPSGAGKSTMFDLLMGFLRPKNGSIEMNGDKLGDVSLAWWREQIAWVSQQPYLLHGSVLENLRFAKPGADMNQVMQAAKRAGAHDFIQSLPDGYDTMLGERGSRLSGGQLQRVALARAFLKDSPFLLLDEPTAHLDPESEMRIQEALTDLLGTRGAIIIAHRLNTIYRSDQILVFAEGQIVQRGTHEQLAEQDGMYQHLVQAFVRGGQ